MLDIGWSELLLVGVLALLVVGPKELPRLMRTVGHWLSKARGLAREFQRGMDDVAREADLKELAEAKSMLQDVQSIKNDATLGLNNPAQWAKDSIKEAVGGETLMGDTPPKPTAAAEPAPSPPAAAPTEPRDGTT